jgi:monoamine oxidase
MMYVVIGIIICIVAAIFLIPDLQDRLDDAKDYLILADPFIAKTHKYANWEYGGATIGFNGTIIRDVVAHFKSGGSYDTELHQRVQRALKSRLDKDNNIKSKHADLSEVLFTKHETGAKDAKKYAEDVQKWENNILYPHLRATNFLKYAHKCFKTGGSNKCRRKLGSGFDPRNTAHSWLI